MTEVIMRHKMSSGVETMIWDGTRESAADIIAWVEYDGMAKGEFDSGYLRIHTWGEWQNVEQGDLIVLEGDDGDGFKAIRDSKWRKKYTDD